MKSNQKRVAVEIKGNLKVVVPESLGYMTSYILIEQNDWFEDEIKFIRKLIQPNQKVIDIGTNYGTYSLTMAKLVGEDGDVWSFEPASNTISFFKQSVSLNGFNNITPIQMALSDKTGTAKFYISNNSELNSLIEGNETDEHEEVKLSTLDRCQDIYGWGDIDFIKLDAEGAEESILDGGTEFLATQSPLIMYELKHENKINKPLISKFSSLGFQNYRLIPGLNILIPFDQDKPFDGYLLNLFACKADRAEILKRDGYLVDSLPKELPIDKRAIESYINRLSFDISTPPSSTDYSLLLNTYIMAQLANDSQEKVAYLSIAFNQINKIVKDKNLTIESLSSCARVAFDMGERSVGVNILSSILKSSNINNFKIKEGSFPVLKKYDDTPAEDSPENWILASIYEAYIEKHAFSTYFTKANTFSIFKHLEETGFMDSGMYKKYQLLKKCYVQQPITTEKKEKTESKKDSLRILLNRLAIEIYEYYPDFSFSILEVGAVPLSSSPERFHQLLEIFPNSIINAIEVDETLCKDLNRNAPNGMRYYPEPLGFKDEVREFSETHASMCASLYRPNEKFMERYNNLNELAGLKKLSTVHTISLDQFTQKHDIEDLDFIKIDIQGAELDVFRGGVKTLENVIAIVTEVEFVPLYQNQPLFGDVSSFLTNNRLMFHKFLGLAGRTLKPYVLNNNSTTASQHMWSDAVFLRDISLWEDESSEKLIKIGILALLYNSLDVALSVFKICDDRDGSDISSIFLNYINKK